MLTGEKQTNKKQKQQNTKPTNQQNKLKPLKFNIQESFFACEVQYGLIDTESFITL